MCDPNLIKRAQQGEQAAKAQVVDEMLELHRKLWCGYRDDLRDDIRQEVALGILRALEDYEPAKGSGFRRYSRWWAMSAVDLYRTRQRHALSHGRNAKDLPPSALRLDRGIDGTEHELHERVPDPSAIDAEETVGGDELMRLLRSVVDGLPEQERHVYQLHLRGQTHQEIADHFGLSRQRIEDVAQAAAHRVRKRMLKLVAR